MTEGFRRKTSLSFQQKIKNHSRKSNFCLFLFSFEIWKEVLGLRGALDIFRIFIFESLKGTQKQ